MPRPVPTTDAERDAQLRRAKASATGFLIAAAAVYVTTVVLAGPSAGGATGFVQAAAEAGMVGGLADWFAVTALFRHPLGIPVPHTALVPRRKTELAQSLASFVGDHFLADDAVRRRLAAARVPQRAGAWLVEPAHAERVTAELAAALGTALRSVRDEDVRDALADVVLTRLAQARVSPVLGGLLGRVVADRAHHGLVDVAVRELATWWTANRGLVLDAVSAQAPLWSPRFVDERIAAKVWSEGVRVLGEVEADPDHPFRRSLDAFAARLAVDLVEDDATRQRVETAWSELLHREDVADALGDVLAAGRRLLEDVAADPDSALRRRAATAVADLGRRLVEDPELAATAAARLADVVSYATTTYRTEVTALVTETVDGWDGREAAERIERHVGRDLQFIRINGTVVGALAGVVIHAATVLLA